MTMGRANEDSVLLVVDVQNDFCSGGALAVPQGETVVPLINRLAERFAHVVLTQDWHPRGHQSFASSHPGKAPFEQIAVPMAHRCCGPTTASKTPQAPTSIRTCAFRMPNSFCARAFAQQSTPIPPFMRTIM